MLLPHALRALQKSTAAAPTYVGGRTASFVGSTGTDTDISLSGTLSGGVATSPAQDDVIVLVYSTGSNSANRNIKVNTAGYLLVGEKDFSNDTYDAHLIIYVKVAGASETTVQVGPTLNANDAGAVAIHVWRNIDLDILVEKVEHVSIANTVLINPPSITPVTSGAIVIAGGGSGHASNLVYNTPALLSNFIQVNSSDAFRTTLAIGSGTWTSGAFDVAQFTLSSGLDSTAYSNNSFSLALKPGPTVSSDYPTIVDATNDSGSNTSSTVTTPTGTASGDLVVIIITVAQNNPLVVTGPSGFATANSYDTGGGEVVKYIFTKTAGGSEPASYTISWTKSGIPETLSYSTCCITLRNATTTGAVYGSTTETSSINPSAAGLTITSKGLLIAYYATKATATEVYPPSLCSFTEGTPNSGDVSSFLYTRKQLNISSTALLMVASASFTFYTQQVFFPRS
jgi:hypothetical protein